MRHLKKILRRTVLRANAGFIVDPKDYIGFLSAARQLQSDPVLRASLGSSGHSYAERTFNLQHTTDKFEPVLKGKTLVSR